MTQAVIMPLWQLQEQLRERRVRLWAEAGALRFEAPAGAVDAALRQALAAHKPALLADLAAAPDAAASAPPIRPAPQDRHAPFPLTDLQQAYWVGERGGAPQSAVPCYVHHVALEDVTPERMQATLDLLQERHEVLRMRFSPDGTQQIAPPGEARCILEALDLSTLEPEAADARAAALAAAHADTALPALEDGPPLAATLIRMPEGCRLVLTLRLIVLDGPSLARLFHDLLAGLYDAPMAPADHALSYRDYVLALQDLPREAARAYWDRALPELPPSPALPRAGRAPDNSRFARLAGRLRPEDWVTLRRRAQERGLTPNAVLLALYAAVLRPWAGRADFTLNVLGNFRPFDHPDMAAIVGNHTNTLLTPCLPGGAFADQARALQQALAERMTHAAVSGVSLCRRLHREGDTTTPPAPFVFTSGIGPGTAVLPPALQGRFRTLSSELRTPQVWLDHQVIETHEGLLYYWDHVEEIFEPGLPEALFDRYETALMALIRDAGAWDRADPAQPAIPALPPLAEGPAPDPGETLGRAFLERAAIQPEAVALVDARGRATSYGALAEKARRIASGLRASGALPGDLVAVSLPRGPDQVACVLGVSLACMAWLPLDPRLPAARQQAILAQSGARTIIAEDRPGALRPDSLAAHPPLPDMPPPDGAALAYVIYTSGSTGTPKGVAITHAAVLNTLHDINRRFAVGPGDRVLGLSALSFDLSVYDIWGSLIAGAALVLPPDAPVPDPAALLRQCARDGVTLWNSVPAFLDLAFAEDPAALRAGLAGLRVIMLSGDWVPLPLARAVLNTLPEARLHALGGATEASIWSNTFAVTDVPDDWRSVPYGHALAGQQLHVLDGAGHPCPPLATGEIHIEGHGLAQGYYRDPARSAASFRVHPSGRRLYATGDLGRVRPDGAIEFLGRTDFQLKLRGFRIEAGEIETHLLRAPGLSAAAVTILRDGAGQDVLVACCVGALDDPEALLDRLRGQLPDYMVPRHLLPIDEIPLGRNGKRDRQALQAVAWAALAGRPPAPADPAGPDDPAIPPDLARLWAAHTGTTPRSGAAHFFRDGGTSVQAVRLVQALRREMGAEIDLARLFHSPTLAALAALVAGQDTAPDTATDGPAEETDA